MKKLNNVVMLPTEKASNLFQYKREIDYGVGKVIAKKGEWDYFKDISKINLDVHQCFFSYFTSPSIEEGGERPIDEDWCYHPEISQDYIIIKEDNISQGKHPAQGIFQWKDTTNPWYDKACKVVATTNPDLWTTTFRMNADMINYNTRTVPNIPKIPLDFVERYVKEQGNIKQVMIEYENYGFSVKGIKESNNTDDKAILDNPPIDWYYWKPVLNNSGAVKVYPIEERKYSREEFRKAVRQAWIMSNGVVSFDSWFDKHYPI